MFNRCPSAVFMCYRRTSTFRMFPWMPIDSVIFNMVCVVSCLVLMWLLPFPADLNCFLPISIFVVDFHTHFPGSHCFCFHQSLLISSDFHWCPSAIFIWLSWLVAFTRPLVAPLHIHIHIHLHIYIYIYGLTSIRPPLLFTHWYSTKDFTHWYSTKEAQQHNNNKIMENIQSQP